MDAELRRLLDRQEILDCIHRYTRGVDRLDADLVLSAYHEDAVDSHGPFAGSPQEFVDWLWPRQAPRRSSQHIVTNHTVELDGDVAHAETYWLVALRGGEPEQITFGGGRYIDRFDRRDGEWRIAVRNVVSEWTTELPSVGLLGEAYGEGRRDRTDMSYERPLQALGALLAQQA
jgi:ketosteroid isomerase-like protein